MDWLFVIAVMVNITLVYIIVWQRFKLWDAQEMADRYQIEAIWREGLYNNSKEETERLRFALNEKLDALALLLETGKTERAFSVLEKDIAEAIFNSLKEELERRERKVRHD